MMKRLLSALAATLFVTVGFCQDGPGGVGTSGNMVYWFDANQLGLSNGNPVATWTDMSGNGNNITQATGSLQPTFLTGQLNGKPAVSFDGTDDYLEGGTLAALNTQNLHWIVVFQSPTLHNGYFISSSYSSGGGGNSGQLWGSRVNGAWNSFKAWGTKNNNEAGKGQTYGASAAILDGFVRSSGLYGTYLNGGTYKFLNGLNATPTGHQHTRVGANSATLGDYFNGIIAEMVVFSGDLDNAGDVIIQNHFSTKYGITLAQNDYYAHDGTHGEDLIGVGKYNGGVHNDSRGSGILRISSAGLGSASFLMAGHNGAATTTTTTGVPAGTKEMMNRVWRADVTGTANTPDIDIDVTGFHFGNASGTDYVLLIDDDGDFSNGGTTLHTTGLSFSIPTNVVSFTNAPIADGNYFTLGVVSDGIISIATGGWRNTSTWSCGCIPSSTNDVTIQSGHTVTVGSATGNEAQSVTVNTGGTLRFASGTNYTLDVYGDVDISGSVIPANGVLEFAGSSNQEFDYHNSDTVNIYKVVINNAGATVSFDSGYVELVRMDITAGDLNKTSTSNSEVIFTSTSGGETGYISAVAAGSSITGSFTFQRVIGSRSYDWMDLGSPVISTLAEWDQRPAALGGGTEIYMSGVGGVDGDACCPIWNSVYTYNVSSQTYTAVTTTSEALSPAKGFEMWMADGPAPGTLTNFVFDTRGIPNFGSFDVSANLNKNGAGSWTLLANPYPAWINWLSTTRSGVKNEIWFYDATISNYVLKGGSPIKVPPHQGFYVESTSATNSLTFTESCKTTDVSSQIYEDAEGTISNNLFALHISSHTSDMQGYTYFRGFTADDEFYNAVYDTRLLRTRNKWAPVIYTIAGTEELMLNSFSSDDVKIPVKIEVAMSGDYFIELSDPNEIGSSQYSCIQLRNVATGVIHNLGYLGTVELPLVAGKHDFELLLSNKANCEVTTFDASASEVNVISSTNTNERFEIQLKNEESLPLEAVLFNSAGQMISSNVEIRGNYVRVEKAGLSSGMYVLVSKLGNKSVSQKFTVLQ